jgi:FAD/FMN-containing dehydrogenase
VVRPGSTEEVAAVVRLCAAAGTPIVPQGGNTGLVVGGVPDASGREVVLSLTRMNRVRAIDAANLTMTVDAGCVLQNLQQAAEDAGYLFPLSLAAEGSCTIGGNLATNAGGTQVLRYGNTRDLCLGLEVVTAQGDVWDGLTGLRKDNTGYDLRDLFIGSEGTLGIITGATMKLYPQPAATLTAWAAVPSMEAAVTLLGLAHKHLGAGLTGFEVMGQFALSLVAKHTRSCACPSRGERVLRAAGELRPGVGAACARAVRAPAGSGAGRRLRHRRRGGREHRAGAGALACAREHPAGAGEEGLNIKHDISIPVSRIPAFCAETDALLQREIAGVRLVNFGHLGDGNLHYNVQAPEGGDMKAFLREQEERVNTLVYDQVKRFDGSISAEHGIGALKADKLPHYKSPVAMGMMRALKKALDPQNIRVVESGAGGDRADALPPSLGGEGACIAKHPIIRAMRLHAPCVRAWHAQDRPHRHRHAFRVRLPDALQPAGRLPAGDDQEGAPEVHHP